MPASIAGVTRNELVDLAKVVMGDHQGDSGLVVRQLFAEAIR
jgi:hypothetical protein